MKRSALKRVGLLDENFGLGHYEDDDLSVRFLSYGYLLVLCHDSFIYHFGNRSFAMKKAENLQKHQEMIENNRKYFIDKWGFDLNDYIMNMYDVKLMLSKVYNIDRRDEGLSAMEIKNLLTFDEYHSDNCNSNEQFGAGKNVLISENTKEIEDEKNTAMSTCAGVSIIIPTHNKIEFTKQCIESIRRNTQYLSYQIIVVDNCSSDGTVEWLNEQDDLIVVLLDKYIGYTKSCNIGIELSEQN